MTYQPVWILWLDSCSLTTGWHRERMFKEQATTVGMTHESIGFVVAEDDVSITIAQNRGLEPNDDGDVNISEVVQIPKVALLQRMNINVPHRDYLLAQNGDPRLARIPKGALPE